MLPTVLNDSDKFLTINVVNIEELIFRDQEIWKKLPHFSNLFQTWKLGQFTPQARPVAQKALLDLLNLLDDGMIHTLEEYFHKPIRVEKLDYTLVKEYVVPVTEAQHALDRLGVVEGELFLHRDADQLYIGAWH